MILPGFDDLSRIIKRYDDPEDLAARLKRADLEPQVGTSREQFVYAVAISQ